jgi:hypothetical protein
MGSQPGRNQAQPERYKPAPRRERSTRTDWDCRQPRRAWATRLYWDERNRFQILVDERTGSGRLLPALVVTGVGGPWSGRRRIWNLANSRVRCKTAPLLSGTKWLSVAKAEVVGQVVMTLEEDCCAVVKVDRQNRRGALGQ